MSKIETPELDKVAAHRDESRVVMDFLEWLRSSETDYVIASYIDDVLFPISKISKGIKQLLAEFFEIDLEKVEEELRILLEKQHESSD